MYSPAPTTSEAALRAFRDELSRRREENLNTTCKPFRYSRLGHQREIRLLLLLPGHEVDFIRCRLIHCTLGDEHRQIPKYEALSYRWGEPEPKRPIQVRDDTFRAWKLMVTENLCRALKRLRSPSVERTLWVDAICINQYDTDEKNMQVSMMRDIYQRASMTVIWLGEASENSNDALALIPKLLRAKELDAAENIERDLWALSGDRRDLPKAHKQIWYDLFDVLRREWFYRAWIVQELAVSPETKVFCGSVELEWDALVQAVNYTVEAGGLGHILGLNALQQLQSLDYQRRCYQRGQSFEAFYVLLQNRKSLATDPKDHVLAFHGFFTPGTLGHRLTRPRCQNNEKDSYEEIYTDIALELLKEHKSLDLFTVPRVPRQLSQSKYSSLPTWVPDWSTGDIGEAFLWREINPDFSPEQRGVYRASANSAYDLVFRREGKRLKIRGWKVDEVLATGPVNKPETDRLILSDITKMCEEIIRNQSVLGAWEYLAGLVGNQRPDYPAGGTALNAYGQTLLGGCTYGFDPDAIARMVEFWLLGMAPFRLLQYLRLDRVWLVKACFLLAAGFLWLFPSVFKPEWVRDLYQVNPWDGIILKLATHIGARRLIKTDEGLIGLAPSLTEPADAVVICQGGKLPLILRPKGQDWELIGECYVHGLMDGRFWDMLEGTIEPDSPFWEMYKDKCERQEFWLV